VTDSELTIRLYNALDHRPDAPNEATELKNTLVSQLTVQAKQRKVPIVTLNKLASELLSRFDVIASARYINL
jgi:hypothetical protein